MPRKQSQSSKSSKSSFDALAFVTKHSTAAYGDNLDQYPDLLKEVEEIITILDENHPRLNISLAKIYEDMCIRHGYNSNCSTFRRHIHRRYPEAYDRYWAAHRNKHGGKKQIAVD